MLYNLNNIDKIFYNNKEYSSMYIKNKEVFTNEIKKIKKYYYTKDSSYINFFSEDFKNKGSIKLPDILSGCTIEYDFIYNCFVGYKLEEGYFTIVYFTIDILNKTLNISIKNEGLSIKNCYNSSSKNFYIPGGLVKFKGRYYNYSGYYYSNYYEYKLFNPYNSEIIDIFSESLPENQEQEDMNISIFSLQIEKDTNKLVVSSHYKSSETYDNLKLIINKNEDKIKVEYKHDIYYNHYSSYFRYTNDNNIAFGFSGTERSYYDLEKTLFNFGSAGSRDYNCKLNMFECRMIKNNKYYFLNNYYKMPYIDIVDYPITENKNINSIGCVSNSCEIPIILNNEIYSSNFYDKIVKYNEETSSFDLIDNFIDFGTSNSQEFLCFI